MHYFSAFLCPVLLEVFFICGSTYSSYFTSVMPIFFHTYQQEVLVTQNEFCFKVIWQGLFYYLTEPLRVHDHTVECWDCLLSNGSQILQEHWNGVKTTQVLQPCTLKVWQGNRYGLDWTFSVSLSHRLFSFKFLLLLNYHWSGCFLDSSSEGDLKQCGK